MNVGAELAQARRHLGLSVEEVSARTKINIERLSAIEEMDSARLPSLIYLKGFLRAYAAEVQLDPEVITERYLSQLDVIGGFEISPPSSRLAAAASKADDLHLPQASSVSGEQMPAELLQFEAESTRREAESTRHEAESSSTRREAEPTRRKAVSTRREAETIHREAEAPPFEAEATRRVAQPRVSQPRYFAAYDVPDLPDLPETHTPELEYQTPQRLEYHPRRTSFRRIAATLLVLPLAVLVGWAIGENYDAIAKNYGAIGENYDALLDRVATIGELVSFDSAEKQPDSGQDRPDLAQNKPGSARDKPFDSDETVGSAQDKSVASAQDMSDTARGKPVDPNQVAQSPENARVRGSTRDANSGERAATTKHATSEKKTTRTDEHRAVSAPDRGREPASTPPAPTAQISEPSLAASAERTPDAARRGPASTSDAERVVDTRPGATGNDLTGRWTLTNRVESSTYAPFNGMNVGFHLQLQQEGDRVTGSGQKWMENGRSLPPGVRTPISLEGTIEGDRLLLKFTERGARRSSAGTLTLDLTDAETLSGTFESDAANSQGTSLARRVQSPRR